MELHEDRIRTRDENSSNSLGFYSLELEVSHVTSPSRKNEKTK